MIGVLPSVSQTDLQGVMGLIAFLADPKACERRLKELNTLAQEVQDKSDAFGMEKNAFDQLKKDVEVQKVVLDNDTASVASQKLSLQESMDAHKEEAKDFDARVKLRVNELSKQTQDLTDRENAVTKREKEVSASEDRVKYNLEVANKTKTDLDNKLAQFKALAY